MPIKNHSTFLYLPMPILWAGIFLTSCSSCLVLSGMSGSYENLKKLHQVPPHLVEKNMKNTAEKYTLTRDSVDSASNIALRLHCEEIWEKQKLPKALMTTYAKKIALTQIDGPIDILLSKENQDEWKEISQQANRFPKRYRPPASLSAHPGIPPKIVNWFIENTRPFEKKISTVVILGQIDWNLTRVVSDQPIWWTRDQILHWASRNYNWRMMIAIGDILKFDNRSEGMEFPAEELPQIKTSLCNWVYTTYSLRPHDQPVYTPWGISKSSAALRKEFVLEEDPGKSLHDARVEKILGPLGPESNLGKLAGDLSGHIPGKYHEDLELSWILAGLNLEESAQFGKALSLGAKIRYLKTKGPQTEATEEIIEELVADLKNTLNLIPSTTKKGGMVNLELWFSKALGREEYRQRLREVRKVYNRKFPFTVFLKYCKQLWIDFLALMKRSFKTSDDSQVSKSFWKLNH